MKQIELAQARAQYSDFVCGFHNREYLTGE